MTIKPPACAPDDPDRDLDSQLALEPALHAVLDEARAPSWSEQGIAANANW